MNHELNSDSDIHQSLLPQLPGGLPDYLSAVLARIADLSGPRSPLVHKWSEADYVAAMGYSGIRDPDTRRVIQSYVHDKLEQLRLNGKSPVTKSKIG